MRDLWYFGAVLVRLSAQKGGLGSPLIDGGAVVRLTSGKKVRGEGVANFGRGSYTNMDRAGKFYFAKGRFGSLELFPLPLAVRRYSFRCSAVVPLIGAVTARKDGHFPFIKKTARAADGGE